LGSAGPTARTGRAPPGLRSSGSAEEVPVGAMAISQLPREPTFRPLGYATLTRDYAILPMLGRSYWPMLAMLSLPYTGYAHAILCWCFILAYSDSNRQDPPSVPEARCSRWGYTWEAAPVRVWAVVALQEAFQRARASLAR
jgi:hypothetical protein